jgi:hypothetical protein
MAMKRTSLFLLTSAFCLQASAATIVISNQDAANVGFNDPTPSVAAQQGNNPGATLGAMRLKVFEEAAKIWGGILNSNITITVDAGFESQGCSAGSATLGQAGATASSANFGAGMASTAYPIALAESLKNAEMNGGSKEIRARFNIDIDSGDPDCLGGEGFYYGLDDNVPVGMSALFPVVLHELGHGLGFVALANVGPSDSGAFVGAGGFPDTFSRNLEDEPSGKSWDEMTAAERKASALSEPDLVWKGAKVTADRAIHLGPSPELVINAPGGIAGEYLANLGAQETIIVPPNGVTGAVVDGNTFMDLEPGPADGCGQISFGGTFTGKIVLFDEPACSASVVAFYSQIEGAAGVVIIANSPNGLPDMSGTVSLPMGQVLEMPYIGVEQSVGDDLRASLGSANVTIRYSSTMLEGENGGLVKMYAPAAYESGSSVSHWSQTATPDLLMEPSLGFLEFENVDLTAAAFFDIGWSVNIPGGVVEIIYEDGFE